MSCAGLVPVMRLAQDCDLAGLVAEHLKMTVAVGANAHLKIPGIVAGMLAGADCIDDLDVLRHGGMGELFGGVRAPSTLGSFLRGFDWGNVRQLEVVSRRLLAELAAATPVLADAQVMAHLDIDSAQRRVYGHAKQGAGFGAAKVGGYTLRLRGLNPLLAAVSTPTCAPVLVGTRLRGGTANSARGAASFVAESITTARAAGATGLLIARMDSAFYNGATIAACRRGGVRFSVTARMDKKITKAIAGIPEHAWTPIRYPNAIFDEDEQRWISDAEVAEVPYTAFASKKAHAVTAQLIVRRVALPGPTHPGRAAARVAPPRGLHRQPAADARRRDRPPRPRHHRTGDRRPHRRPARAPALRRFRCECRLVDLRRDRAQPAPCRRDPGLAAPRQGPRRHRAPRADQRPGPARAPRTRPADPAPTPGLALARRLRRRLRRHPPRTTRPRGLTGTRRRPHHLRASAAPSRTNRTTRTDNPQNRQRRTIHALKQANDHKSWEMIT